MPCVVRPFVLTSIVPPLLITRWSLVIPPLSRSWPCQLPPSGLFNTTKSDALPLIVKAPLGKLRGATVNTLFPKASSVPVLAFSDPPLVMVTGVPPSTASVAEYELMAVRAGVTAEELATTPPVTVPPPLTVKGPGFELGLGLGVRPVVFDAPEKKMLPVRDALLSVNCPGEPMPTSPVMVPVLKLVWGTVDSLRTANWNAPSKEEKSARAAGTSNSVQASTAKTAKAMVTVNLVDFIAITSC